MSSMRNAVQRRNHKERAQPLERQKWGLLEKKADYKLRAKDHKEKKARLRLLKQKAADKNPDEFSFAMMSSKVDKHGQRVADRGNKPLSMDVVKLLKTQDAAYIRTMLQVIRKERKQLEEEIVLDEEEVRVLKDGEDGRNGKHTVFVSDKDEQKGFKPEEWFETSEDQLDRLWNRPRKAKDVSAPTADTAEADSEDESDKKLSKKQLEAKLEAEKEEKKLMKKRDRLHEKRAIHLEALKKKERDLMTAEEELEKQRAKMNGTVGGVNKDGVKFKIGERKR